jgi:hypothetical protein
MVPESCPSPNSSVWTSDPLLMGVETHWYRESQLVRIVKPEVVRQFLEEELSSDSFPKRDDCDGEKRRVTR